MWQRDLNQRASAIPGAVQLRYQVISQWLDNDRFNLMQRDDDYQRYLVFRRELFIEKAETDDYQELMTFALTLTAEERDEISKQAMKELLAGEAE